MWRLDAGLQRCHRRKRRGRSDGQRCGARQDSAQDDGHPARYGREGEGGHQEQVALAIGVAAPITSTGAEASRRSWCRDGAVTSTFPWSGERCTAFTWPMLTFLYFTKALPGSIPGPV